MGIPGFYRWITERFPKVSLECKAKYENEEEGKADITAPNPNGFEFDNLYIGHTCLGCVDC
jgi:5'-3' exonuclease